MFYFHGSPRKNLNKILKEGLIVERGRATFTTNPLMTLGYGEIRFKETDENINSAMLIVIEDKVGQIRLAKDSDINIDDENKKIEGWVNRYKNEQFGYYSDHQGLELTSIKNFAAIFGFSQELVDELRNLKEQVKNGRVNRNKLEKTNFAIEKILARKDNQLVGPAVAINQLANSMATGLIRNILLLEIRKVRLSKYLLRGWEIENYGDHAVNLYNSTEEINKAIENVSKALKSDFIDDDVRKEFEENRSKGWI